MKEKNSSKVSDREITSSRIFNAPREQVWKIWSEPKHLALWWGPKGFKNTIHEHQFKPGGRWSFIMHGPDGTDYKNENVYVEMEKPSRIVLDHVSQPRFRITATFTEVGERTKVNFHMVFESASDCEAVKDVAILGNEQNFDRMEAELSTITQALLPKEFVLSRTFDAPQDLMWKMWTDPKHMARWSGPKEVTVGQSNMDFRRGGTFHSCMVSPDGQEMWGKYYYRDIVKPSRLMYVNTFSDKDGRMTRHPMAPQWPLEMLSLITFEEKAGKTTVTIRWYPINATEEEIKIFNDNHSNMNLGWGGSLDRLEQCLQS